MCSVGQHGSAWHTAEAEVSTAYRAFSKEKVMADLGVNIGLNCVNVTLKALPVHNQSSSIDYNERFYWIGSSQMKHEYHNALVKVLYILFGFLPRGNYPREDYIHYFFYPFRNSEIFSRSGY
jgi:hypothetical protein